MMANEFTDEELKEVIRTARIFNPAFNEEQFQSLVKLQGHFADSDYLETVSGLRKLERDRGIPLSQALETHDRLLRENKGLEKKLAAQNAKLEAVKKEQAAVEQRCDELVKAIQNAAKKLEELRQEKAREEKELAAFEKKAASERKRIDEELGEYRRRANVTEAEIIAAGQVKAEVASHGLTLELVLSLTQEFAGHENAREELSRGLTEHQTLSNYIANLKEQGETQKKELELDLARLQSEKGKRQAEIAGLESRKKGLADENIRLENVLSQLQSDIASEEELRRFYRRYQGASRLMELLAGWRGIFFVRCSNPLFALTSAVDRSTAGARFWTEKPPVRRCPCCDYPDAAYDEAVYQALNLAPGTPVKLQLGE